MIPHVKPRRALILGLGAGTVAHLLTRRFGAVPIVAVDDDPETVEIARRDFGLELDNLGIVIGDAFDYVESAQDQFDLILVDLYHGPRPASGMVSRPSSTASAGCFGPRGQAVFNLYSGYLNEDRLGRLRKAFRSVEIVPAASNRIVFCK